jgi:hypothetical protein
LSQGRDLPTDARGITIYDLRPTDEIEADLYQLKLREEDLRDLEEFQTRALENALDDMWAQLEPLPLARRFFHPVIFERG